MGRYFIVYNPGTYDLMSLNGRRCACPLDLVSHLTNRDAAKLDQSNYLDYLQFDEGKRREGMVDTFGIDNGALIYIANQIGRLVPQATIIQADNHRRPIRDVIERQGTRPEAVFMTAMSSNFPAAAAATIVLNHARISVVLGGIHVSTATHDVALFIRSACPCPDRVIAVRGPGDSCVISEVLRDLERGAPKRNYDGHITIEDGVWRTPPNVQPLPSVFVKVRGKVPMLGRILDRRIRIYPVAPLLGCPYSCSFCSISTLPREQRRLTTRTPNDFLDELASYQDSVPRVSFPAFFFCTDNLLLGGKVLDEMLDGMIERNLKAPFIAQISVEVASNDALLERLRLAGALLFEIGLESLDMRNLESIGKHAVHDIKKSGLSVAEYYSRQIRNIQDHGVAVQGSFIFGLPYDRFDSYEDNTGVEIARFCMDNHISLMASCLSAQPGARAFQDCLEAGTLLYGKPGTMDYLRALSIADHGEMNIRPPDSLKGSPLLVGVMALEALRSVAKTRPALRSAAYMARKAFVCPTARGRASFKERVADSLNVFAAQLITIHLYRDHGERLAFSNDGRQGGLERLYGAETNPDVRRLCEDYVTSKTSGRARMLL